MDPSDVETRDFERPNDTSDEAEGSFGAFESGPRLGFDSESPVPTTSQQSHTMASSIFVGQRVGRYVVLDTLGEGGMGVVARAYDPRLQREVAIKKLRLEETDESRGRLVREAQAMARLIHPNVLPVYDAEVAGNSVFLTMELVEGTTLSKWMRAEPRPWRVLLELFISAGRGLEAAHAVGMVHRDFKPSNVLLGDDGRVRVADFGLAQVPEAPSSPSLEPLSTPSTTSPGLTKTGTIVGTPPYMAPEQHDGVEVDARGDQYAFCISLWEGLFGARPFSNPNLKALGTLKRDGPPNAPPDSRVPRSLIRTLQRGLAPTPEHRFESMTTLLRTLERHLGQRRRIALGTLLAGGLATVGIAYAAHEPVCRGAEEHLVGIWDARIETELESAVMATGAPFARTTWEGLAPALSTYAEQWVAQHETSCRATRVYEEQTTAELEAQMQCLDGRLTSLGHLVSTLMVADAAVLSEALPAALQLPEPAQCGNRDYLERNAPLPVDPELRDAVIDTRTTLDLARTWETAGRYEDALELLRTTEDHGYLPLTAEREYRRGTLLERTGDFEQSRQALERAFFSARRAGLDEVAAEAANVLVFLLSVRMALVRDAAEWARFAEVEATRLGDPRTLGNFHNADGLLHRIRKDHEGAVVRYARARKAWSELDEQERPLWMINASINEGFDFQALGRLDDAQRSILQARELVARVHGPGHPKMAPALSNLARIQQKRGQVEDALATILEAIEFVENSLGPEHPLIFDLRHEQAEILLARGELLRAGPIARDLIETTLEDLPGRIRLLARPLYIRISELDQRGEHEARAELVSRVSTSIDTYDGYSPSAANVMIYLGELSRDLGDFRRAKDLFERAAAIYSSVGPPNDDSLAQLSLDLGFAHAMLGNYPSARDEFETSAKLYEEWGDQENTCILNENIGFACLLTRDWPCAEYAYRKALAYRAETTKGFETRTDLANALTRLGRADEVEAILHPVLERSEPESRIDVLARTRMAEALLVLGRVAEARGFAESAVDSCRRTEQDAMDESRAAFVLARVNDAEGRPSAEIDRLIAKTLGLLEGVMLPGAAELRTEVLSWSMQRL